MSTAKITPREPRVFTREEPCTKVHLYNCFMRNGRFVRRAVVEARGDIGLNAIKYLKNKNLAVAYSEGNIDYWELTPDGKEWLEKGLVRHLELHPEDIRLVNEHRTVPTSSRRVKRTR